MPAQVSSRPVPSAPLTNSSRSIFKAKNTPNVRLPSFAQELLSEVQLLETPNYLGKSLDGIATAIHYINTELEASRAQGASTLPQWKAVQESAELLREILKELDTSKLDINTREVRTKFFIENLKTLFKDLAEIASLPGVESEDHLKKIQDIEQVCWPQLLAKIIIGLLFFTKTVHNWLLACLEQTVTDAKAVGQDLTRPPSAQNPTFNLLKQTLHTLGQDFKICSRITSLESKYEERQAALQILGSVSNISSNTPPLQINSVENERIKELVTQQIASYLSDHQRLYNQESPQQPVARLNVSEQRSSTPVNEEAVVQQAESFRDELDACKALEQKVSEQEKALQTAKDESKRKRKQIAKLKTRTKASREEQRAKDQRSRTKIKALNEQLKRLNEQKTSEEQALRMTLQAAEQKAAKELAATEMLKAQIIAHRDTQEALLEELKVKQQEADQRVQTEVEALSELDGKLTGLEEEIAKVEAELRNNQDVRAGLEEQINALKEELAQFAHEKIELTQSFNETETTIVAAAQELKNLVMSPEEIEVFSQKLQAKSTTSTQFNTQYQLDIQSLRAKIEEINAQLNAFAEEKTEREQERIDTAQQTQEYVFRIEEKLFALEETQVAKSKEIAAQNAELEKLRVGQQEVIENRNEQLTANFLRQFQALAQQVSVQEQALETVEEEITELQLERDILSEQQEIEDQDMQKSIDDLNKQVSHLVEQKASEEQALHIALQVAEREAAQELAAAEVLKATMSERIGEQSLQLAELKAQQQTLSQRAQAADEARSEHDKQLTVLEQEIAKIEAELEVHQSVKAGLEEQINALKEALAQFAQEKIALMQSLNEAERKIAIAAQNLEQFDVQYQADIQAQRAEIEGINTQLNSLAEEKTKKEQAAQDQAVALEKRLHDLEMAQSVGSKDIAEQSAELAELRVAQEAAAESNNEQLTADFSRQFQALAQKVNAQEQALETAEEEIAALRIEIERSREQQQAEDQSMQKSIDDLSEQKASKEEALHIALQAAEQKAAQALAEAEIFKAGISANLDRQSAQLKELRTQQQAADQRAKAADGALNERDEQLVAVKQEIAKKVESELSAYQDAKAQVEDQIKSLTEALAQFTQEKTELARRLNEAEPKIAAADQALEKLERLHEKIDELSQKAQEQSAVLAQFNTQHQADIQTRQAEVAGINAQLESLVEEKAKIEQERIVAEQDTRQQAAEFEKELRDLEATQATGSEKIAEQSTELAKLKAVQQVAAEKATEKNNELNDRLKHLEQEKTQMMQRLSASEQSIAAAEQELKQHQTEIVKSEELKAWLERLVTAQKIELTQKDIAIESAIATIEAEATKRSELLKEEIRLLKEELKELSAKQVGVSEALVKIRMLDLDERLQRLEKEKNNVTQEPSVAKQRINALQDKLASLEQQQQDYLQSMKIKSKQISNELELLEQAEEEAGRKLEALGEGENDADQEARAAQASKIGRLIRASATANSALVKLTKEREDHVQHLQEECEQTKRKLALLKSEKLEISGQVGQEKVKAIEGGLQALEKFKTMASERIERFSGRLETLEQSKAKQQADALRLQKEIDDINMRPTPLSDDQAEQKQQQLNAEVQATQQSAEAVKRKLETLETFKTEASAQIERLTKQIEDQSTELGKLKAQQEVDRQNAQQKAEDLSPILKRLPEDSAQLTQAGEAKVDQKQDSLLKELAALKIEVEGVRRNQRLFTSRGSIDSEALLSPVSPMLPKGTYAQSDSEDSVMSWSNKHDRGNSRDSAVSGLGRRGSEPSHAAFGLPPLSLLQIITPANNESAFDASLIERRHSTEGLSTVSESEESAPKEEQSANKETELLSGVSTDSTLAFMGKLPIAPEEEAADKEITLCVKDIDDLELELGQECKLMIQTIKDGLEKPLVDEVAEDESDTLADQIQQLRDNLIKIQLRTRLQKVGGQFIEEELMAIGRRLNELEDNKALQLLKTKLEAKNYGFLMQQFRNLQKKIETFEDDRETLLKQFTNKADEISAVASTNLDSAIAPLNVLMQKADAEKKEAQQLAEQFQQELKKLQADKAQTEATIKDVEASIKNVEADIERFEAGIEELKKNQTLRQDKQADSQKALEKQIKEWNEILTQLKVEKVEQSNKIALLDSSLDKLKAKIAQANVPNEDKESLAKDFDDPKRIQRQELVRKDSEQSLNGFWGNTSRSLLEELITAKGGPFIGRVPSKRSIQNLHAPANNTYLESEEVRSMFDRHDEQIEVLTEKVGSLKAEVEGKVKEVEELFVNMKEKEDGLEGMLNSYITSTTFNNKARQSAQENIKKQLQQLTEQLGQLKDEAPTRLANQNKESNLPHQLNKAQSDIEDLRVKLEDSNSQAKDEKDRINAKFQRLGLNSSIDAKELAEWKNKLDKAKTDDIFFQDHKRDVGRGIVSLQKAQDSLDKNKADAAAFRLHKEETDSRMTCLESEIEPLKRNMHMLSTLKNSLNNNGSWTTAEKGEIYQRLEALERAMLGSLQAQGYGLDDVNGQLRIPPKSPPNNSAHNFG